MMEHLVVVGGGTYGTECYEASSVALQFGFGDREGIQSCTRALEYGDMNENFRIAILVNRGIIYAAMGEFQRASADYQRAENMNDEVPEIYVNRGNLWFSTARYGDAIEAYSRALELGMHDSQVGYLNRAFALERLGNFEEALADYQRALEIAPEWNLARQKIQILQQRMAEARAANDES